MSNQIEFQRPIETDADVTHHLNALLQKAPDLTPIAEMAGPLPLRRSEAGLASLVRIICGQFVSTYSAAAVYARLEAFLGVVTPNAILEAGLDGLRSQGLTQSKSRTIMTLAEAVKKREIDLHALGELPPKDAIAALTKLKGIGPWTAEVYLVFATGHPDIFPSGDLALQIAVQDALNEKTRPDAKALAHIATRWAPHRGVATRLFWGYYAHITGRAGI